MDWKQFFSTIIGDLSWPVTVVIIIILVRDKIEILFNKVGHFKYKDLELDFDKFKEHAEKINLPKATKNDNEIIDKNESDDIFGTFEEQILETVEKSPIAAILLAWSTLETSIASSISRLSISPESPSYRSPLHNIEMLDKSGELSSQQISLLNEMRMLRNKVAHQQSKNHSITQERALDYANTAIEMINILNNLKRVRKTFLLPKGDWIHIPENFEKAEFKGGGSWIYSYIDLANTNLTAGVGPWKTDATDSYKYYGIDIEYPTKNGSHVIAELRMDIKYVSSEILTKKAHEFVQFNIEKQEVIFDLGKNIFKYKFKDII